MSNPSDPIPEPIEAAAQYRVSAQELSHVVNIIQARKEAEAKQRANTVALGEAVEQLGLEMTPDELLAEIQADRARRSGSSRPKRQQNAQRHTFATFAVCAGLAGMMVSSIHMHNLRRANWESRNNPLFLSGQYAVDTAPASQDMMTALQTPAPDVATSAPVQFRAFGGFGEYEKADCDFDSLRDLANGKSGSEIMVQANGTTNSDKLWTIEKRDGEVSVYAFAAVEEFAKVMNGHAAHIYASSHDGLQEMLLPLQMFKNAELLDIPGQSGAALNPTVPNVSEGQKVDFKVRGNGYEGGIESAYIEIRNPGTP
jgi:hypothetical protein